MRKTKRNELRIRRLELMEIMHFVKTFYPEEYTKKYKVLRDELRIICKQLRDELDFFPFTD